MMLLQHTLVVSCILACSTLSSNYSTSAVPTHFQIWPTGCVYMAYQLRIVCTFLNREKKIPRHFSIHKMLYWNTAMLICFCIRYGRHHVAHEASNIYYLAL